MDVNLELSQKLRLQRQKIGDALSSPHSTVGTHGDLCLTAAGTPIQTIVNVSQRRLSFEGCEFSPDDDSTPSPWRMGWWGQDVDVMARVANIDSPRPSADTRERFRLVAEKLCQVDDTLRTPFLAHAGDSLKDENEENRKPTANDFSVLPREASGATECAFSMERLGQTGEERLAKVVVSNEEPLSYEDSKMLVFEDTLCVDLLLEKHCPADETPHIPPSTRIGYALRFEDSIDKKLEVDLIERCRAQHETSPLASSGRASVKYCQGDAQRVVHLPSRVEDVGGHEDSAESIDSKHYRSDARKHSLRQETRASMLRTSERNVGKRDRRAEEGVCRGFGFACMADDTKPIEEEPWPQILPSNASTFPQRNQEDEESVEKVVTFGSFAQPRDARAGGGRREWCVTGRTCTSRNCMDPSSLCGESDDDEAPTPAWAAPTDPHTLVIAQL